MSDTSTTGEGLQSYQGHEARVDRRAAIPLTPIKIGDGTEHFFGVAMNISHSGIFVQTPAYIGVGKVYVIEFTLPRTATTVRCFTKVVWNRSMSLNRDGVTRGGLKFMDIDPEVALRIDECVKDQPCPRA